MADGDFIGKLCKEMKLLRSLDSDMASQTIEEGIKHIISKTQENCKLSKVYQRQWHPEQGDFLHPYVHNPTTKPSGFILGKTGSLVVSHTLQSSMYSS
jgi:translation elongation factor EF-Ts